MKPKAYEVSVEYAERCSIVFAETPSKAKANWAHCGEFDWVEIQCRRAPEFDDLVDKGITIQDYLERDWFFNCTECGTATSYHHEPPTIILEDKWPCCTEECAGKFKLYLEEINAISN